MIRVCIVCEGQTEVEFIKTCIAPHLIGFNVHAYPSILQARSGKHRGGRVTVDRLVNFLSHQYHEANRLTTLVDFYGFQDRSGRTRTELEQAIFEGVERTTTGFDQRFLLPYVQMHEFEALLFSDVNQFQFVLDGWNNDVKRELTQIRAQFATPEEINDSPETAPSKRILKAFDPGTYSKTVHGPVIADEIGLTTIRAQCPQFHQWLQSLEAWGCAHVVEPHEEKGDAE